MNNTKSKFRFCPRKKKSKSISTSKNIIFSELIEPKCQIMNQLSPNKFLNPAGMINTDLEKNELNQFEIPPEHKVNNNEIINYINNDNNIKKESENNIYNNNNNLSDFFIDKQDTNNNFANILNLNNKIKFNIDNVSYINNENNNNLSYSKSTKNNTNYTSFTIGKNEISQLNIKKITNNKKIKRRYNNTPNTTFINSFINNDNQQISKIDYYSITDKDSSNLSYLNLNLSGNKIHNILKREDLIDISKRRKILFPMTDGKNYSNIAQNYPGNQTNIDMIMNSRNKREENSDINILKCLKISNKLKKKKNKINFKKCKLINNNIEYNNYSKNNLNILMPNKIFNIYKSKPSNNSYNYNKLSQQNKICTLSKNGIKNFYHEVNNKYNNINNCVNNNIDSNNCDKNSFVIQKNEIEYIPNLIKREEKNDSDYNNGIKLLNNIEENNKKKEIILNIKELKRMAYKNGILNQNNNNNYDNNCDKNYNNNDYISNNENNKITEEDEEFATENNNNEEEKEEITDIQSQPMIGNEENASDKNKENLFCMNDGVNSQLNFENNKVDEEDLSSIIKLKLSDENNQISENKTYHYKFNSSKNRDRNSTSFYSNIYQLNTEGKENEKNEKFKVIYNKLFEEKYNNNSLCDKKNNFLDNNFIIYDNNIESINTLNTEILNRTESQKSDKIIIQEINKQMMNYKNKILFNRNINDLISFQNITEVKKNKNIDDLQNVINEVNINEIKINSNDNKIYNEIKINNQNKKEMNTSSHVNTNKYNFNKEIFNSILISQTPKYINLNQKRKSSNSFSRQIWENKRKSGISNIKDIKKLIISFGETKTDNKINNNIRHIYKKNKSTNNILFTDNSKIKYNY